MKFTAGLILAAIGACAASSLAQNGADAFTEKAANGGAKKGGRCRARSASSHNHCGLENIKIVPDAGFYPFSFQVPYDPIHQAFYFKSDKLTMVTVVDCFCEGDSFQFYDNGALIGVTSTNCPADTFNPDQECNNPLMDPYECTQSTDHCIGGAYLLPGFHNITLQTIHSPFSGGTAFIRVDTACQTYQGLVPCCQLPGGNCYNGLGPGFVM